MKLDTSLLLGLAWRAVHLKRARDTEAGMALSMFQGAASPENVIELLAQVQDLQQTLAALGELVAQSQQPGTTASREVLDAARQAAEKQRQYIGKLEKENRALNERTNDVPAESGQFSLEAEPSEVRAAWKLVPASFIDDALCAVDLVFALRENLTTRSMRPEDVREWVEAYAGQLEAEGYEWNASSRGYPEHPLLELEPPRLVDEEILRDAQLWRDQLWHKLEVVDIQTDTEDAVRSLTVWNRETGKTSLLTLRATTRA